MDTNEEVLNSVNSSTEQTPTTNATFTTTTEDIHSEAQAKQSNTSDECQGVIVISDQIHDIKNIEQCESRSKSDLLPIEDVEVHYAEKIFVTTSDVEKLNMSENSTINIDDVLNSEVVKKDNNGQISTKANAEIKCIEVGPNTIEENEAFGKQESTLIKHDDSKNTEDVSLEIFLKSSSKTVEYNKPNVDKERSQSNNTCNIDNVKLPCNTGKKDTNSSKFCETPEINQKIINPEIILEGVELMQEDSIEDIGNCKSQVDDTEEIHIINENENIDAFIEHEFSTISHKKSTEIVTPPADKCVEEIVSQKATQDPLNLDPITENVVSEGEITSNMAPDNEIEKQMSNIVEPEETPSCPESTGTLSIAEAISRDFDETDTEEIDTRQGNTDKLKTVEVPRDDVVEGANTSGQLQEETVTVTDTSGQIYYVQSVEDLIVVENDMGPSLEDQRDTIEVTILNDLEQASRKEAKPVKAKEITPIPSHILGRHIDNPVIDTFRNGKVPPKPRLGVKIPYKNLTSQIVSKDEIAREILDRQRLKKHKQAGQTTREMLFAKKITQRLAKKIAPSDTSPPPVAGKNKDDEAIDNSDLLAILEGDAEESELKNVSDPSVASTSVSNHNENKTSQNVKQTPLVKTETKKQMSKLTEREIALKQLQELPPGPRRRKNISISNSRNTADTTLATVENDIVFGGNSSTEGTSISKTAQSSAKSQTKVDQVSTKAIDSPSLTKPTVKSFETVPKEALQFLSSTIKSGVTNDSKVNVNETINLPTKDVKKTETEIPKTKLKDINRSHLVDKMDINEKAKLSSTSAKISIVTVKVKTDTTKHSIPTTDATKHPIPATGVTKHPIPAIDTTTYPIPATDVTKHPIPTTDAKYKLGVSTKSLSENIIDSSKVTDPVPTDAKDEFVERKQTGNPPIKTYTRKRKSIEGVSIVANVPDKKPTLTHKDINIPPNTYITKSSRIIKRKVIWDPDEPSTARSLVLKSPKTDPLKLEKPIKVEISPSKGEKKFVSKLTTKIEIIKSPTRSPDKCKKRLTEVDRLLMDEGAINMLYAFKNVDEAAKKKKAAVISVDKVQRELINKSNEIKKDLTTNSDKVSPKSLRRKDSPIPIVSKKIVPASISRKKSKDSNQSSLHSPPASPSMMYSNIAEASRIIRRHSSSSYSSMEGDFESAKRVEMESQEMTMDSEKHNKKRIAPTAENNKSKKVKKNTDKENVVAISEADLPNVDTNSNKTLISEDTNELKYVKYKTFSVKEIGHMVQIILLPSFNNEAYLAPEILNELCSIMKELQDDSNCTIVVISSSASSFCHGINYKDLIGDKEQSRKAFAKKLATCVTNFLKTLATFPKILVAGVHGDTVGLGVTMLPLFDMVIASDTATFSIPNARLGCAAEGGSLLSLPHLMHNVLVSELLYASRKLIAAEALRLGMVTRVLWPDKFQQELISIVKGMSNHSSQFMELTKKQLRQHMTQHIDEILSKEVDTLIQHWTSLECQKNFGVYG